jgi:hypothetical protein
MYSPTTIPIAPPSLSSRLKVSRSRYHTAKRPDHPYQNNSVISSSLWPNMCYLCDHFGTITLGFHTLTLGPVFIQVFAQRNPRYLLRIVNRYDEVFALVMFFVERHYLKHWSA